MSFGQSQAHGLPIEEERLYKRDISNTCYSVNVSFIRFGEGAILRCRSDLKREASRIL
jgi:hypothetical protein